jgi:hypothetical protein
LLTIFLVALLPYREVSVVGLRPDRVSAIVPDRTPDSVIGWSMTQILSVGAGMLNDQHRPSQRMRDDEAGAATVLYVAG